MLVVLTGGPNLGGPATGIRPVHSSRFLLASQQESGTYCMLPVHREKNKTIQLKLVKMHIQRVYAQTVVISIPLQSTATCNRVKQWRHWLVLRWVTVSVCQILVLVLHMIL